MQLYYLKSSSRDVLEHLYGAYESAANFTKTTENWQIRLFYINNEVLAKQIIESESLIGTT